MKYSKSLKRTSLPVILLFLAILLCCKKAQPTLSDRLLGDHEISWLKDNVDSATMAYFEEHGTMVQLVEPFPYGKYFLNFKGNKEVRLIEKINYTVIVDTLGTGTYTVIDDKIILEKKFIQIIFGLQGYAETCRDSISELKEGLGSSLVIVGKKCNANNYSFISLKK